MSEVLQRTTADAEVIAAELGLQCVFPTPHELCLDIDDDTECEFQSASYKPVLDVLAANGLAPLSNILTVPSKSGRGYHVYIRFTHSLPAMTRIALQAAMGSDPIKEALSVRRIMLGGDETAAIAMFETPVSFRRIAVWRRKCREQADSVGDLDFV